MSAASKLLTLSKAQLDKLYLEAPPGEIPVGDTAGTAIIFPGSPLTKFLALVVKGLVWKGKVFFPDKRELINKLTPLGIRLIKARVYKGASWLDGKETIVLDYSKTSIVARMIRDEIREIEPGLFLGEMWLWKWRPPVAFALVPAEQQRATAS